MAGSGISPSNREILQTTNVRVPNEAVQVVIAERFPNGDFTMGQLEKAIMEFERDGEYISSSLSDLPPIPEDWLLGRISGSVEVLHDAPFGESAEIMHWPSFSGSFNGTMELPSVSTGESYPHVEFQTLSGSVKYFGSSALEPSTSVSWKISGSFNNNSVKYSQSPVSMSTDLAYGVFFTSSAVTPEDLNQLSQSSFVGAIIVASSSLKKANFTTGTNFVGSSGMQYLDAVCELAFGSLGTVSSSTQQNAVNLQMMGEFWNSGSLNEASHSDNVSVITNIIRGNTFTLSGSLSHSIASLSDGQYIQRASYSPSGSYFGKSKGNRTYTRTGAKNRVALSTNRSGLNAGTATGRKLTNKI